MFSSCHLGNVLCASFSKFSISLVYTGSERVLTGLSVDESCWVLETAVFQKPCCASNQSRIAQYAFTDYRGLCTAVQSVLCSQAEVTSPSLPFLVNRILTMRRSLQER